MKKGSKDAKLRVLTSNIAYADPWLKVEIRKVTLGEKTRKYSVVKREDSVVVIPRSPTGQTILLKQLRIPTSEFSWEFPMGAIDSGESPNDAAKRELREETGLTGDLVQVGKYRAVPGLTEQTVYIYLVDVAEVDLKTVSDHILQQVDEIVSVSILNLTDVQKMIDSETITDGFTLAAWSIVKKHLEE